MCEFQIIESLPRSIPLLVINEITSGFPRTMYRNHFIFNIDHLKFEHLKNYSKTSL